MKKKLISTAELAVRWGMSEKTLRQWVTLEKGVEPCKIGRSVRYDLEKVVEFEKISQLDFKERKIKKTN